MQFSVGVEYAFHSLFYLIGLPQGKIVGIKDLAALNRLTETYLSKIFSKLRKGGIVRSVPGVKGGYELAREPGKISFWDVIEAVEGSSHFFQCAEIRKKNIFVKDPGIFSSNCPCLIKVAIAEGEERMRDYLRGKSLEWLHTTVEKDFTVERKRAISKWFMTK
ncbi:MAG: Rrf2 family transcriptional regulator [Candidatus Riflebacteria bacterium]|nr:Rrf2 family transcriptional regulator [Candidatus Riflebacteria bacterium]